MHAEPIEIYKYYNKMLYKGKGEPTDINKYRGITLENVASKIFSKIITQRIQGTIDNHFPENQFGFRKGRSSLTAIELLLNNIWDSLERNETFYRLHQGLRSTLYE